jgi:phospholipase C
MTADSKLCLPRAHVIRAFAITSLLLGISAASIAQSPVLTTPPPSTPLTSRWTSDLAHQPHLTHDQKLKLLRRHIKYVFVLFQENRSFDFYFGTYPAADGLYSRPSAQTAGFTQTLVDTTGALTTIQPFKIPISIQVGGKTIPLYPWDLASSNHAHTAIARKLDLDPAGVARNDQYALTEEGVKLVDGKPTKFPSLERKQMGELVMSHIDCDAAPFLWQWADRFTLFDNFFDTVVGPSGPNAIAMIAGQSGQTEWMLHPSMGKSANAVSPLPMVDNAHPYWGLAEDAAGNTAQPQPNPEAKHAPNLTFATLPLSFMGDKIQATTAADYNPAFDLMDVHEDIEKIAGHGIAPTNWGWYQQGYAHETNDPAGKATHKGYVIHHNGPQYFGYVADNPLANVHMHSVSAFFADVASGQLPSSGVFYVRGGYGNIFNLPPSDPNPKLATVFNGDDDHPGYSDSAISEALLAKEINAIAQSPYWKDSVIVIAYDESDGLYDHAQPRVRNFDALGIPLNQGPRIPFLLLSPYGISHAVSHERTEHSSLIRFVDELFNLIPLADLPDEAKGRQIGHDQFHQDNLGPADDGVPGVGDLFSGFDDLRLLGKRPLLPASFAEIPEAAIETFPHYNAEGCKVLHITPTDANKPNPLPPDFNPRPANSPGTPSSGNWTP